MFLVISSQASSALIISGHSGLDIECFTTTPRKAPVKNCILWFTDTWKNAQSHLKYKSKLFWDTLCTPSHRQKSKSGNSQYCWDCGTHILVGVPIGKPLYSSILKNLSYRCACTSWNDLRRRSLTPALSVIAKDLKIHLSVTGEKMTYLYTGLLCRHTKGRGSSLNLKSKGKGAAGING